VTQLAFDPPASKGRRIIVGFSGGVTSAWCAGWALRTFPREEVVFVFHDTKEEDPDTYRFIKEMIAALDHPLIEMSDGRSVSELFEDLGFLGNNQQTMCSRILKREIGERYERSLVADGYRVTKVVGFSGNEPDRIAQACGRAHNGGYAIRFPMIEELVTKQQCADWCQCEMGVKPSAMYEWSEHANCVGCVRGGRDYWLAVHANRPDVFWKRSAQEQEFGHSIIRGENPIFLADLVQIGLKRKVGRKEAIVIGACECGD
jgi:hypothetical protein